jgi:hypothetical protein
MAKIKRGMMLPCTAAAGLALACLLMMAGAFPALAETAKLTQSSVKRFIESYPEVKTIAAKKAAEKGKKIGGADNALMAVVEAASDDAIKAEIDTTAKRHGFRDGKEWSGVARSVGIAYAHVKTGTTDDAKARRKLEKAIAKVDDMPLLNDKQKKQLIENLRKGAETVLEPQPPENVALVKAMAPEIEAVVKK